MDQSKKQLDKLLKTAKAGTVVLNNIQYNKANFAFSLTLHHNGRKLLPEA